MKQAQNKGTLVRVLMVLGVLLCWLLTTAFVMAYAAHAHNQALAWFVNHVWLQPGMCLVYLFGSAADDWVLPVNVLEVAILAHVLVRHHWGETHVESSP